MSLSSSSLPDDFIPPEPIPFYKQFILAGMAGLVGCTATFPLDFSKSRLQSSVGAGGKKEYRNMFDVMRKVAAAEGVGGLYSGLRANLTFISFEKAIKLAFNQQLRQWLNCDAPGPFKWGAEMLAGGGAGAAQMVITCPMEILKIRMQLASSSGEGLGMVGLIRSLGLRGLYVGSTITLLRDVPFSMMYFSLYAWSKRMMADPVTHKASLINCFLAGTVVGVVSSIAVTPPDVIKTKLQAKIPDGVDAETYPRRILPMARLVVQQDGVLALFKGSVPRAIAVAPLFGVALFVFEGLKDVIP